MRPSRILSLIAAAALAVCFAIAAPGTALAAVRSLDLPFPRTALWWPAEDLSAEGLSRYDLLILGDYDRAKVATIRARNPDIVILDSTNACELPYHPDSATGNAELRRVPAQWLLTQVGSTLAEPVAVTDTVFRVASVTGPDGLVLFEPGDSVVVDDEIAYVLSVDGTALTVRRGKVKSPTTHLAGARVAATVSFWGEDLVFDLTAGCPRLLAEGSPIPETWAEYNARQGSALLADPRWDGLLVDRSDGDESWIIGRSTARSLDPDRSNTPPTDYRSFDAAWNEGLGGYVGTLRQAAGPDRILIGNWAHPGLSMLDGNVFEGFPQSDGRSFNGSWRQSVFGPLPGFGGYLEWMTTARQPALCLLACTSDDSAYNGEASVSAVTDEHRKARLGLTTTLLGDGFYAYQVSSAGRGATELTWLDEYDGGGVQPGYLGRPLGPARRSLGALSGRDMLTRGGFESTADLAAWEMMTRDGYVASVSTGAPAPGQGAAAAVIDVTAAAGKGWYAHYTRGQIATVTAGEEYTVTFWAKADRPRVVSVWLQGDRADTRVLADLGEVALDTSWRLIEVAVQADYGSGSAGTRLHIGVGQSVGRIHLDSVRVRPGSREVWRRDFTGGTVLVNGTTKPRTIWLGGIYRKIRGEVDPVVNNGSTVTAVTVPPLDGVVLLRTKAIKLNPRTGGGVLVPTIPRSPR